MIENLEEKLTDILSDQEVRFAGIVDSRGALISRKFRKGVVPFESDEEQKKIYQELAARALTRKKFDHSMGPVKYSASRREKIVIMSFPVNNEILFITAEPNINIDRLAYRIMQKLESHWNDYHDE